MPIYGTCSAASGGIGILKGMSAKCGKKIETGPRRGMKCLLSPGHEGVCRSVLPGRSGVGGGAATPSIDVGSINLAGTVGTVPTGSKSKGKRSGKPSMRERAKEQAEQVCQKVMAMVESGNIRDWEQGWQKTSFLGMPANPVTGKPYRGGYNRFVLALFGGRSTGSWAGYKQWEKAGCQVRKGERGMPIFYPKPYKCCRDRLCINGSLCGGSDGLSFGEARVFNADQVDGDAPPHPFGGEFKPLMDDEQMKTAESISAMFAPLGADVRWGGDRAAYSPLDDYIVMPTIEQFNNPDQLAAVMAHELVHWTGHKDRCGREMATILEPEKYAREELVAELGSVLVCARLGIEYQSRPDHEAYLAHYAEILGSEKGPEALKTAMTQAGKAADFIVDKVMDGLAERLANSESASPEAALA